MADSASFAVIDAAFAVIFAACFAVIFRAFRSGLQRLRVSHAWVCAVRVGARAAQAGERAGGRACAPRRHAQLAAIAASPQHRTRALFFPFTLSQKNMEGWA